MKWITNNIFFIGLGIVLTLLAILLFGNQLLAWVKALPENLKTPDGAMPVPPAAASTGAPPPPPQWQKGQSIQVIASRANVRYTPNDSTADNIYFTANKGDIIGTYDGAIPGSV